MSALVVSSNEIDALAKKAAKGAGLPWGLAADAGKSVRWLADHGLPGPEMLADLLDWRDGRTHTDVAPPDASLSWGDHVVAMDPIVVGTVCADLAARLAAAPVELGRVRQPLLLGFALSVAAAHTGTALVARWDGAALGIGPTGVSTLASADSLYAAETGVIVEPAELAGQPRRAQLGGCTVDPGTWARLERFAHRTYAPDTEQSRLTGAGAGLIDD